MKTMRYNRTRFSIYIYIFLYILMNTKICPYAKPLDSSHISIFMKIILTYIDKHSGWMIENLLFLWPGGAGCECGSEF